MKTYGVWEPHAVKAQTIKTAIESACLLLRVDDIVSGLSRKEAGGGGAPQVQQEAPEVGCIAPVRGSHTLNTSSAPRIGNGRALMQRPM